MLTYYGPTPWDDDPGHIWHEACPVGEDGHDGEVRYVDDGLICSGCGEQEDQA